MNAFALCNVPIFMCILIMIFVSYKLIRLSPITNNRDLDQTSLKKSNAWRGNALECACFKNLCWKSLIINAVGLLNLVSFFYLFNCNCLLYHFISTWWNTYLLKLGLHLPNSTEPHHFKLRNEGVQKEYN